MIEKEPAEAATDIIKAWLHGRPGAHIDGEILRHAYPFLAHLPTDELACLVLQQLRLRKQPLAKAAGM